MTQGVKDAIARAMVELRQIRANVAIDTKRKLLKDLVNEGMISKKDYQTKLNELYSKVYNKSQFDDE